MIDEKDGISSLSERNNVVLARLTQCQTSWFLRGLSYEKFMIQSEEC